MSGNGNHNDNGGNRYSYSGADCKVFAYRNNVEPIFLESVQTISFSIHEPRGRARALGFRGVKGFSRSVREIAGTMIFTVIEDHPLAKLMTKSSGGNYTPGWSVDGVKNGIGNFYGNQDYKKNVSLNRVSTAIPSFNLMLTYATEVISNPETVFTKEEVGGNTGLAPELFDTYSNSGANVSVGRDAFDPDQFNPASQEQVNPNGGLASYKTNSEKAKASRYFENSYSAKLNQFDNFNVSVAGLVLEGIEIITEGIVTSVNDMITEVQVQFVAKNYKEFSLGQYGANWETDIDFSEAYEYMKETYKQHAEWDRYENDLETYEIDYALTNRGMEYGGPGSLIESETNFSPLLWETNNNGETVYTIHSQTNLNPTLSARKQEITNASEMLEVKRSLLYGDDN